METVQPAASAAGGEGDFGICHGRTVRYRNRLTGKAAVFSLAYDMSSSVKGECMQLSSAAFAAGAPVLFPRPPRRCAVYAQSSRVVPDFVYSLSTGYSLAKARVCRHKRCIRCDGFLGLALKRLRVRIAVRSAWRYAPPRCGC